MKKPLEAIRESLEEFRQVDLWVKEGSIDQPSLDFYVVKLRFLHMEFERLVKSLPPEQA